VSWSFGGYNIQGRNKATPALAASGQIAVKSAHLLSTRKASLTARLDRLGSAREVAQIGAVIGRGFSYGLLRDVAGMDDAALQGALERLAEADILLVQGLPPEADYRFKHALIQDAAYENLLKSRRQVLHRRVAETLRNNVAVTAAAEPELLAHHFTQAGMTEAAIEWWGKAGQDSLERSALVEAVEQFKRALKQIAALPATPTVRREQIKLQVALINPLMHVKGYGAPETKAASEQARLLIELPARYLKLTRAAGLGHTLFHDLRRDLEGNEKADFPLNQAAWRRPDAWRARFQRVPPPLTLGLGNDPVMGFNRRRMEAERKAKADAEQKAPRKLTSRQGSGDDNGISSRGHPGHDRRGNTK
jgi:hypothetical protein